MKTRRKLSPQQSRKGFTLIELLVVISIIAMLMALILPGIQNARRNARNVQCKNRVKNVSLAIFNKATQRKGAQFIPLTKDISGAPTARGQIGWVYSILPELDQQSRYDEIKALGGATTASTQQWMEILTCPDDTDSDRQPGGLSFVVNAGFMPNAIWDGTESATNFQSVSVGLGTTDTKLMAATGVIWRDTTVGTAAPFKVTLDYLGNGDGSEHTILLAENLDAGSWTSINAYDIGFGARIGELGTAGSRGALHYPTPNLALSGPDSTTQGPRPSSGHAGVINIAFASGKVSSISSDIDQSVYLRLLTSAGHSYGEELLGDDSY